MKKQSVICAVAILLVLPVLSFAQGTNAGATVTAPFVGTPPVIDGTVSDGEWDAASVAEGTWSFHDSDAEAPFNTTVKVCYSVDAVYFLFECEDSETLSAAQGTEYLHGGPNVDGQQESTFGWAGDTDYIGLYVDPSNYSDDAPNADDYSYSIQWEPSITAKNEKDANGNSYNYSENGKWGGFNTVFNPPIVDNDGVEHYWGGGVAWQCEGLQVVDGPMEGGYLCEVRIPWQGFSGYWRRFTETGVDFGDNLIDMYVNADNTDPYLSEWGGLKTLQIADDTAYPVGTGIVTGMPLEGQVWKIQFCRYSNEDGSYVNWVGDTGSFVTRPFGDLVFGPASAAAVEDAMLH